MKSSPTSSKSWRNHNVRQRPETTILYQLIRESPLEFKAELVIQDKCLPACIIKELNEYLK